MDPVVAVYADGGVIGSNPSLIGGTWAYCFVGEGGERLVGASGLLLPTCRALGVLPITNNICEFLAIGKALAALPAGWSGIVYSDSQNAMQRWFNNAACNGLPLEWIRSRRAVKQRLGAVQWEVIQGHPTRSELEAGRGRRGGAAVSIHNVWCDEACVAAGLEYAVSLGMAECERLLGKPYRRLVEHRKKEERKAAKLDHQSSEVQSPAAAEAPVEEEVYRIPTARGVFTPYTPDYEFPEGTTGNIFVTVMLDDEELALLRKPAVGSGGFQSLLRQLQVHCLQTGGNRMRMARRTALKVVNTSRHKKGDGYQGPLKRIAEEAAKQLGGYVPPDEGAILPDDEEGRTP